MKNTACYLLGVAACNSVRIPFNMIKTNQLPFPPPSLRLHLQQLPTLFSTYDYYTNILIIFLLMGGLASPYGTLFQVASPHSTVYLFFYSIEF